MTPIDSPLLIKGENSMLRKPRPAAFPNRRLGDFGVENLYGLALVREFKRLKSGDGPRKRSFQHLIRGRIGRCERCEMAWAVDETKKPGRETAAKPARPC